MLYNYRDSSTLDLVFDDQSNELIVKEDIIIEESLVRKMKDMRSLFNDASGYDDELPLYYMYNGIYRREHQDLFKQAGIKYEYTILPALMINGECLKAHGHIHGISPITKTNFIEVYEVLDGKGCFQLFKLEEDTCEVVIIEVKPGDFIVVPPNYYHLSINTGDTPFNFGDLIATSASSDYSVLKDYYGAPFFCMKDQAGNIRYQLNQNYREKKVSIAVVKADSLPWNIPLANVALYAHFVANPRYFDYIK